MRFFLLLTCLLWPWVGQALPKFVPPQNKASRDVAIVVGTRYTKLPDDGSFYRDGRLWYYLLRFTIGLPDHRIAFFHQADPRTVLSNVAELGRQDVDTLWIVIAAHGAGDLLITWGANDDPESIEKDHSISRQELLDAAGQSGAKRIIIVLDSCRTGLDRIGKPISGARFAINSQHRLRVPGNAIVWSAAQDGQYAHTLPAAGHGLFSYYAVRAFSGDAGQRVDISRANDWVADQLATELRSEDSKQTPELRIGDGQASPRPLEVDLTRAVELREEQSWYESWRFWIPAIASVIGGGYLVGSGARDLYLVNNKATTSDAEYARDLKTQEQGEEKVLIGAGVLVGGLVVSYVFHHITNGNVTLDLDTARGAAGLGFGWKF